MKLEKKQQFYNNSVNALSLLTHILGNLTFLNKQVGAKDMKKKDTGNYRDHVRTKKKKKLFNTYTYSLT